MPIIHILNGIKTDTMSLIHRIEVEKLSTGKTSFTRATRRLKSQIPK